MTQPPQTVPLLVIAGARPNSMKVAPLMRVLRAFNEEKHSPVLFQTQLVHTGQHYDPQMSDIFFSELGIPAPDINLEVGSGSHAEQTARVMLAFEPVCLKTKPRWIIVVGDVNSTMACSLVASKLGIRVAHVEAGLRSFDRNMPEEVNRIITDALADLLFTPSRDADANLKREGIGPEKIRFVGNIMVDTVQANLEKARQSAIPGRLGLTPRQFVYVTLHRPSNVDHLDSLKSIVTELIRSADRLPVVFPAHPRTRKMLQALDLSGWSGGALKLVDPVGYHDSLWLTENARFVLTDSGGLQEESTYLRTPCLTLRPNTERPVTIEVGTNKLTTPGRLASDINEILAGKRPAGKVPEYWDGQTAERIVADMATACLQ